MGNDSTVGFLALATEVGVVDPGYPLGDVRRYCATLDGTTDDTTALNNAIASAQSSGIPVVQIPRGRMRITSTITINATIVIQGVGFPPGGINDAASNLPTVCTTSTATYSSSMVRSAEWPRAAAVWTVCVSSKCPVTAFSTPARWPRKGRVWK
jgi:hypothetical protein